MKFDELFLHEKILDSLNKEGYEEPSKIQKEAIPPALCGRDILGCAQTGTGKTAAFALPILNKLANATEQKGLKRMKALILSPTRELSQQIYESFKAYSRYLKNIRCAVIMGGVSQHLQVVEIERGVDVLIATPGRLIDLYYQGYIDPTELEFFVLDEADRMLDMGFINDVKKIIEIIPKKRQTMFFTATMPPEVKKLTETILNDPVHIQVTPVSSTVDTVSQSVYFTDKVKKLDLITWYLHENKSLRSSLIFTRTKYGADKLCDKLKKAGIRAASIHGDKSQGQRQFALDSFKKGSIRALVATDIAARGIDIDDLSQVINFELPNEPETYVHRIGRTGRAGKSGIAVSFCDIDEKKYLEDIEKLIKKKIEIIQTHPFEMTNFQKSDPKQKQKRPHRFSNNNQKQNPKK